MQDSCARRISARSCKTGVRSLLVDGFEFGAGVFQACPRCAHALMRDRVDAAQLHSSIGSPSGRARRSCVGGGTVQFAHLVTARSLSPSSIDSNASGCLLNAPAIGDLAIVTLERRLPLGVQRTLINRSAR